MRSNARDIYYGAPCRNRRYSLAAVYDFINRWDVCLSIARTDLIGARVQASIIQRGRMFVDVDRLFPFAMAASVFLMLFTRNLPIRAIANNRNKGTCENKFGLPLLGGGRAPHSNTYYRAPAGPDHG